MQSLCRFVQDDSGYDAGGEAYLVAEDRGHDENEESSSRVVVVVESGTQSVDRRPPSNCVDTDAHEHAGERCR